MANPYGQKIEKTRRNKKIARLNLHQSVTEMRKMTDAGQTLMKRFDHLMAHLHAIVAAKVKSGMTQTAFEVEVKPLGLSRSQARNIFRTAKALA